MKHLHDLPVLVLGLGASGLAMARWCARHGAHVTVADTRDQPPQLATLQREVLGARFVGGALDAALVEGTAIRVLYRSPGLSPQEVAPVCDAARALGLPIGGELTLFAQALADLAQADAAPALEEESPDAQAAPTALRAPVDDAAPAAMDDTSDGPAPWACPSGAS